MSRFAGALAHHFDARKPWRIDEDNERRIVVKNDAGEVVHQVEYDGIPQERGPAFAEQIISFERDIALTIVRAVNAYHGVVALPTAKATEGQK